jgi:hypothetical protein
VSIEKGTMMKLEEIINNLDNLDNSLTICASKTPIWTPSSEADVYPARQVPLGARLPYFLEVGVAKNVLRAWSYARGGQLPNLAQRCEAIIYFAENDAYLLPEDKT